MKEMGITLVTFAWLPRSAVHCRTESKFNQIMTHWRSGLERNAIQERAVKYYAQVRISILIDAGLNITCSEKEAGGNQMWVGNNT